MAELGLIFISGIKALFLFAVALVVLFVVGSICYGIGYLLYSIGRGLIRFGKGKFDPYDSIFNKSGDHKDGVARGGAIFLIVVSIIFCVGLLGISMGL